MKVLIACEYSGTTRDAFAKYGWDAWSCDLLPTEAPGNHYQGSVFDILHWGWDLLIGHPPCTYLTNSSVGHLSDTPSKGRTLAAVSGQARWVALHEAGAFFNALWNAPIPRIALENPIPHSHAKVIIGDYTQVIQPWQFGHDVSKGTCLWLKNLPTLQPEFTRKPKGGFVNNIGGKDRQKRRSRSFEGIAQAMASQWTLAFLDNEPPVQS